MTKYFMRDTPLAGLERLMMTPPNFQAKGGGKQAPYQYTAADCDCRYCLKAEKEKIPCREAADCVCFEERLVANCWTHGQLAEYLTYEIADQTLTERVRHVLPPHTNFPYKNLTHRRRMIATTMMGREPTPHLVVVFLLSADSALWRKSSKALRTGSANLCRITVNELCDPMLIGDELLRLLISALVIRRYAPIVCLPDENTPSAR